MLNDDGGNINWRRRRVKRLSGAENWKRHIRRLIMIQEEALKSVGYDQRPAGP